MAWERPHSSPPCSSPRHFPNPPPACSSIPDLFFTPLASPLTADIAAHKYLLIYVAMTSAMNDTSSPLLEALLDVVPELFERHIIPLLDSDDLAMLARVCSASRTAVKASGRVRDGTSRAAPLRLSKYFGSTARLAWARSNGCELDRDDVRNCYFAARAGSLEVLKQLREENFDWNGLTCEKAAEKNHVELLQWATSNGCPWDVWTTFAAARSGSVEILQFLREAKPWYLRLHFKTCAFAAENNRLEALVWLREEAGAPWDWKTCAWRGCCTRRPRLTHDNLKGARFQIVVLKDVETKLGF